MEIVHLATFTSSASGVLSETAVMELEISLALAPISGDVIPGGKGLRKVRVALQGRGKSGGARVIYYFVATASRIYLVFAYAKNRQGDLTKKQLEALAKFVAKQLP